MQNSLRYLKVPKSSGNYVEVTDKSDISLKNYTNNLIEIGKNELTELGLIPIVIGDGKKVLKQYPANEAEVPKGTRVYLVTIPEEEYITPNLIGKSLREALEYCSVLNIDITFNGTGIVVSQSLTPGYPYNGGKINIILEDKDANWH